jgi:8-oxo-dGTP diphosphatase
VAVSEYIVSMRQQVGHGLLLLPSVSAIVVNEAGQILLGRRSDTGQWSLIAGVMDPGEQPADAIIREIYEETGVRAVVERLVGTAMHPVSYANGDQCQYLNLWFQCRAVSGEARVNDDESLAVEWFEPDALPELDPWVEMRLEIASRHEATTWFAQPGSYHEALGFAPGSQPDRAVLATAPRMQVGTDQDSTGATEPCPKASSVATLKQ